MFFHQIRQRAAARAVGLSRRQRLASAVSAIVVVLSLIALAAPVPAADDVAPRTREFTLVAAETTIELQPGTTVRAWTYNGQMPGPEIRVREGDRVKITLVNNLPGGTTIHWHGLNVPPDQDGPAGLNQAPVEPGASFIYDWIATPGGTRWYHSHTDVATQVMLGLYGSLIVEPKRGGAEYDRDYTYVLSEWDNELNPEVATGDSPRGPRDATLRGGQLGADLFLMNGRIHEAIPPIVVTEGDEVLIRLINAGTMAHPFHTHGHSFTIVATDGNPVPPAARLTKDTILIAPGERYDLAFNADNPGVWMAHCHIENHAANGMMTLIQYEGAKPTGPLAELWDLTPTAEGEQPPSDRDDSPPDTHAVHAMHDIATTQPTAIAVEPAAPTATSEPQAAGEVASLAMEDDRFDPRSLTVTVGTTVTWINKGADWHSVAAFDGSFTSGQIASGESFSHTFTTPGAYKFICKHHGRHGMIGEIIVVA